MILDKIYQKKYIKNEGELSYSSVNYPLFYRFGQAVNLGGIAVGLMSHNFIMHTAHPESHLIALVTQYTMAGFVCVMGHITMFKGLEDYALYTKAKKSKQLKHNSEEK